MHSIGNRDVHHKFHKRGIKYKLFDSAMEAIAFLSRPGVTGLIFRKVRAVCVLVCSYVLVPVSFFVCLGFAFRFGLFGALF